MLAVIVKVHNLTKKYQTKTAIKDFSFVIHAGERIGIIGAHGSEKSTLSEINCGNQYPPNPQRVGK
ncbi:hypothetical protein P344_05810 [Spiroplasma mirum ATCC 29335]|uniref:ABC transporter domain-containing protein n=1 Tax=Spiroplasma mirum ATCC 29335 TaxID=838561 RepID=W0GMD6_9MOLU|nr:MULTISPECIES: hypothetical protein [Spiroplasma]AHF61347.1 truncated ABC-type transport system ATP-binding protein [Spiroplasma mirum ATCC 29335]AHI58469.1 hypothetical protein P344_05810 [Spiroplasma mirum ATCC 29335]